METIINNDKLAYLLSANLITHHQHGFLRFHSTSSQLLECMYDWDNILESKGSCHVMYNDFKKAFDSVSHFKLILKLKAYDFPLKIMTLLKSFLNCRTQTVCINSTYYDCINVLSGVPQGSVIGPILFLLLINDIVDICVGCIVKIYADNQEVYKCIKTILDVIVLQIYLNKIFK